MAIGSREGGCYLNCVNIRFSLPLLGHIMGILSLPIFVDHAPSHTQSQSVGSGHLQAGQNIMRQILCLLVKCVLTEWPVCRRYFRNADGPWLGRPQRKANRFDVLMPYI